MLQIKYRASKLLKIIALIICIYIYIPAQAQVVLNTPVIGNLDVKDPVSVKMTAGFKTTEGIHFSATVISSSTTTNITYNSVATIGSQTTLPSSGQNYIHVWTPLVQCTTTLPTTAEQLSEQIQYFDGLGRPLQNIDVEASPTGKDMVQLFEYDYVGREAKKYLPFTQLTTNGVYTDQTTAFSALNSFYTNWIQPGSSIEATPSYFAVTAFDNSPLNRVVQQGFPGESWQLNGHPQTYTYTANTAFDTWRYDNSDNLVTLHYNTNSLFVTETTDESGNVTREYKDMEGKVVRKEAVNFNKTTNTTEILRTLYVYDDFGLLRCVVPPLATAPTADASDQLCYYYKYDAKHRMTDKKIPGADWVYMIYDQRDRLVLTQDGNQRILISNLCTYSLNKWSYIKYDNFNRPTETGVYDAAADGFYQCLFRDALVAAVGNSINFPTTTIATTAYTKTFYDTYNFVSTLATPANYAFNNYIPTGFDSYNSTYTIGKITGSMKKVLDATNTSLYTVTYYDDYGRVIKTISDNQKGGREIIANIYNFSGQVVKTTHKHILPNASDIYTTYRYVYDHRNRLREEYLTVGANPATDQEVLISAIEYDELGRVKNEKLHSVNQGKFLQKQDYTYNTRGWLTSLNGGDLSTNGDNDLFAYNLYYDKINNNLKNSPLYNGNITAMTWTAQVPTQQPLQRGYKFIYDNINRLSTANYGDAGTTGWTNSANVYNMNLTYDVNGNITLLTRYDDQGVTSFNNVYHYLNNESSNQLSYLAANTSGKQAPGGGGGLQNYFYDANGNLTKDITKGINSITYNYLNLPENISLTLGRTITYKYDATGAKLRKEVYINNILQNDGTQDYVSNFVYDNNGVLLFIAMDKGRLVPYNGTYRFEYFLKDHLGNTRVTFTAAGDGVAQVLQEDHYYPFGMTMPNLSYNAFTTNPSLGKENKFMYNGKELQSNEFSDKGLDWYDYGWRNYDPFTGRFWTIDRFAEKYHWMTPYHYGANNPIKYIDVNGDSIATVFYDKNGKQLKDMPDEVYNMFRDEFGLEVGYNSETENLYFIGDVEDNIPSQSKTATTRLKTALTDKNKNYWKNGYLKFGHNLKTDFGGDVNEGAWVAGTAYINLASFNEDGSSIYFNYHSVPIRAHNLATAFEEEYLGHNYLNSSIDGGNYTLSKVNGEVNFYLRERGLPERLNYGGNGHNIYFGNTTIYKNTRELKNAVKQMDIGILKNNSYLEPVK